jgi:hypothetical protein
MPHTFFRSHATTRIRFTRRSGPNVSSLLGVARTGWRYASSTSNARTLCAAYCQPSPSSRCRHQRLVVRPEGRSGYCTDRPSPVALIECESCYAPAQVMRGRASRRIQSKRTNGLRRADFGGQSSLPEMRQPREPRLTGARHHYPGLRFPGCPSACADVLGLDQKPRMPALYRQAACLLRASERLFTQRPTGQEYPVWSDDCPSHPRASQSALILLEQLSVAGRHACGPPGPFPGSSNAGSHPAGLAVGLRGPLWLLVFELLENLTERFRRPPEPFHDETLPHAVTHVHHVHPPPLSVLFEGPFLCG